MQRETERLRLRMWCDSDFEAYAACYADPQLARFIGGVCDRETAWRKMAGLAGHWALRGFGYWAVEERAGGGFVGCVGLWRSDGWPEHELGYWLTPAAQGNGYGVEAGREALAFARDIVRPPSLVSYIDPRNQPSRRLAERLGARLDGRIELLAFGPHDVWRHDV